MKLGVCSDLSSFDKLELIAKLGFDYIEINFTDMVLREDEEINVFISNLKKLDFKCEAANCFFPGSIKLTGDEIDYNEISQYLEKGMERASRIGIKTVVFGSSGARNHPEGYSYDKAYEQLVVFLGDYAGPAAKKYGVSIAIEPLGKKEANMIFTAEDGVLLGRASGCDNVKGLVDLYHMYRNGDEFENIIKFPNEIIHAHVCHPNRNYPLLTDGYDYKPFMQTLKTSGCVRVSIEGRSDDFFNDLPSSIEVLKASIA